jgi:cell division protein FtsA
MENGIAVGLDIGTTKVCAIVASPDETHPGKLSILGIGRSASDGLTRGVVTNIDKTVRSIQTAVRDAEAQSGVKITSVTVGIAGDHIQSFQSRGLSPSAGPTTRSLNRMSTA